MILIQYAYIHTCIYYGIKTMFLYTYIHHTIHYGIGTIYYGIIYTIKTTMLFYTYHTMSYIFLICII